MRTVFSICLLFAAFSVHAAAPNLVWCNNCNATQMRAAAAHAGLGITYVGDPVKRMVNAYETYVDTVGTALVGTVATGAAVRRLRTDPVYAEPEYVGYINTAMDFYNASPRGWNKNLTVYTNKPSANDVYYDKPDVNVYDIINPSPEQNRFLAWENSINSSIAGTLLQATLLSLSNLHLVDLNKFNYPTVVITVKFDDNSQIDLIVDSSTDPPRLKLEQDTGLDSHDNNVPYLDRNGNIQGLGGSFDFVGAGNPNDLQDFLNMMALFGVPIRNAGSPAAGGAHGWACTRSGEGPKSVITCQRY